jgi:hypothetical protein
LAILPELLESLRALADKNDTFSECRSVRLEDGSAMKRTQIGQHALAFLALVGVLMPQPLLAVDSTASSAASAAKIRDVALDASGTLHGQVLDSRGAVAEGLVLHVLQGGQEVAAAQTDHEGRFQVDGLRGGVYQLATQQSATSYRVWNQRGAPPAAQPTALIIVGQDVVRGQGAFDVLTNPWVLGGIVAAAIAIPLALDGDDDGS